LNFTATKKPVLTIRSFKSWRKKKTELITLVEEKQQAIVIVLLAKNENGRPIMDSQKQAAEAMAKNVLQLAGAEVAAQSSAILFDATAPGEVAKLTATLETGEAYVNSPERSYEFANAGGTGYGPILGSDLQEPIRWGATVSYLPNKEGTYKLSDLVEDTWFAKFSESTYRGLFPRDYTTVLMNQQYIVE
jgi:hypothetical protein